MVHLQIQHGKMKGAKGYALRDIYMRINITIHTTFGKEKDRNEIHSDLLTDD